MNCWLCELVADDDVMLLSVSMSNERGERRGGHRCMRLSNVEIEFIFEALWCRA